MAVRAKRTIELTLSFHGGCVLSYSLRSVSKALWIVFIAQRTALHLRSLPVIHSISLIGDSCFFPSSTTHPNLMTFNRQSTPRPRRTHSSIMPRFYAFVVIVCLVQFVRSDDSDEECSSRDRCLNSTTYSSWSYRDQSPFLTRNCFCDSACEQYGDCCEQPRISE